jgi:selenocysteine lyase/cysteine desulfurase
MSQTPSLQHPNTTDDLSAYREQFPVTRQYVYLNHAGLGPLSTTARERAARVLALQGDHGSRGSETWQGLQASARRRVSALIGAHEHEVCFVKNTPEGISTIASGFPWKPGDNVVVPSCEFPANVYPWLNMRDHGVEVRFVDAPRGRFTLDSVAAAVDARTRIVAVSWVQFLSGYRVPVADLADLCRRRGSYLLLDAIQGLGVLPMDVKALGVHFLATASHKWLLAPMGAGWLFCHEDLIDRLRLVEVGQSTVVGGPSYLEYEFRPKPGARRFEPGVPAYASLAGLDGALDLFEQVGHERISSRILGLCATLIQGLEEIGCEIVTPVQPDERAGIVTFRHPTRDAGEIEATMLTRGVVVVNREGFVRTSPHFYNTRDEIDAFLAEMKT